MAAERTWLAWWRTALGASAGALAVGRFAPELLDVAPWPYILLGSAMRLRGRAVDRRRTTAARVGACAGTGGHLPLQFRTVAVFTVGGVALAVITVALVIAQI